MKRFTSTGSLAIALTIGAAPLHRAPAQVQAPSAAISVPIAASSTGGNFTGTFILQRFDVVGGIVSAVGTVSGTMTDQAGTVTSTVRTAAIPLNLGAIQATCDRLRVELGPANLELVDAAADLSRIVLDIDAAGVRAGSTSGVDQTDAGLEDIDGVATGNLFADPQAERTSNPLVTGSVPADATALANPLCSVAGALNDPAALAQALNGVLAALG